MPYSPPSGHSVVFNFSGAYTPPAGHSVVFNFGAAPPPPGAATWARRLIQLADEELEQRFAMRRASPDAISPPAVPIVLALRQGLRDPGEDEPLWVRRRSGLFVAAPAPPVSVGRQLRLTLADGEPEVFVFRRRGVFFAVVVTAEDVFVSAIW